MPTEEERSNNIKKISIITGLSIGLLGIVLGGYYIATQVYDTGSEVGSAVQQYSPELQQTESNSALDLLAKLRDKGGEDWPPEENVVGVTSPKFPDDLAEVSVKERKELFFRILTPIILAENARLRALRGMLQDFAKRADSLTGSEEQKLAYLAQRYRVQRDSDSFFADLLRRVDEVPIDLAIAQAANESGWGTSRFTSQANNLFGEWTWTQEEGLIPKHRAEGKTHRIRVFDSLQGSVRSYFYTLNVGNAYADFRDKREELRAKGLSVKGYDMATTLISYSERGKEYVEEIRSMISYNNLNELNGLKLQAVDGKEHN